MKKILKWTGIVILVLISGLFIYIFANQHKKFDAPFPSITASTDSIIIERGRSLVFGAAHCANCHSPAERKEELHNGLVVPLSGGQEFDLPIGKMRSPNLTPDATGIGNISDGAIARALRFGVGSKGEALFDFMPFHNTSDEDIRAIISFLRSQPAVKNEIDRYDLNLLGKGVKAIMLKPVGPDGDVPVSVKADTTVEYGKYLANNIANCRGCHTNRDLMTGAFIGPDYAGGLKFDMSTDSGTYSLSSPNLTPDRTGRITEWTQDQFLRRFRQGVLIPETHMPWGPFGRMTDDELKAIYKYLKTVPAVKNEVPVGVQKEN